MKNGHQGAGLQVRTPKFELDPALMVFNITIKFETYTLKTKDCKAAALTRQMLTHARTEAHTTATIQHRDH